MVSDSTTTMLALDDLEDVPLAALEEEIATLASQLDAGTSRWLELLGELARRDGCGLEWASLAQWLSFRCAVAPAAAREYLRVAERLTELPLIRAAFSRGELSYDKVRELTRVAETETEAELLELAEALTVTQLQRSLRAYRWVTSEEAEDAQSAEMLDWYWDDDGSLVLRARLAPEDGALVVRALERARDAARERRRQSAAAAQAGGSEAACDAPRPDEAGCPDVDALVAMADLSLGGGEARPAGERSEVVVHVDVETLAAGAEGRAELADGPAIAGETARRLACDAGLVLLAERDGLPLSVGRRTRTISPALRRALQARDGGCRFPGCTNTRFVEAHHVTHWAHGGETRLDNLLMLCRRHHRLLHEGSCTVDLTGGGEARFTNRHGVALEAVPRPPPGGLGALLAGNRAAGVHIDGDTGRHGLGDPLDLDAVVAALDDILTARSAA